MKTVVVMLWCTTAAALIAYDCQNKGLNITTFSLTDIGACKPPTNNIQTSQERIQLIQVNDIETVKVVQCKIKLARMITHCGMHSHSSSVADGFATYIYPVTRDKCFRMHQTQVLVDFFGKNIDGLVINGTTHATAVMAGWVTADARCQGAHYEDHKGSWADVVVQATLEITLQERYASAITNENKIILTDGMTCPYKERFCVDTMFGHSFWDHVDSNQCAETKYTILYEGLAKKLSPEKFNEKNSDAVIYSVDQGDMVFAMPIAGPTMICGQTAYETDHPKFFIIKPSETGIFYFKSKKLNLLNMDPTTYVNSKVVFVEKHLGNQISALYADVVEQRCMLEQQVLRNLQTLAITAPSEFAFAKMQVPGYTAFNYGEVVHILQCTPVEVSVRNSESCYHELPIIYDNKSFFMTPRNHIIQKFGTEIGCNPFLYSSFKVQNRWYKNSRGLHEIPTPQTMEPNNQNRWKYTSPGNLFKGGLYTQKDMLALQEHLFLPSERKAVTGIISRGMIGLTTDMQGTNFGKLIDEVTINVWFKKAAASMWHWFTLIGTVTSGLMGFYMIGKGIKFMIDTVIHGFLLYEIFGVSLKLMGALLDSITMYFIHKHHSKRKTDEIVTVESGEMQSAETKINNQNGTGKTISTLYPGLSNCESVPTWLPSD